MKSMDLFCASPASTAICTSMDQYSIVRGHGRRPVDRYKHYLQRDRRRKSDRTAVPCSSQLPLDPIPNYYHKSTRSSSSGKQTEIRRKSSADVDDLAGSSRYLLAGDNTPFIEFLSDSDHHPSTLVPSKSSKIINSSIHNHVLNLKRPPSKSIAHNGYPLVKSSSTPSSDSCRLSSASSNNSVAAMPKSSSANSKSSSAINDCPLQKSSPNDQSRLSKSSSANSLLANSSMVKSSSSSARSSHQVVELRVSIHCKGCEGKVRKQISKIEGVTSYNIDLATKKVTIVGNVTPLGVLTSISRVKNAQFWPSPTSTTSSPSLPAIGFRY